MSLSFYALSILAGLVGGIGDALLNKWMKTGGNIWWLGGGYGCWLIALTLFVFMLKRGLLAHCVVLFLLANCLFVIAASNVVFHEPISAFPKFKKLEITDKEEVEKITSRFPPYSDFNFTSMWRWDTKGKTQLSILNDNLIVRFTESSFLSCSSKVLSI